MFLEKIGLAKDDDIDTLNSQLEDGNARASTVFNFRT